MRPKTTLHNLYIIGAMISLLAILSSACGGGAKEMSVTRVATDQKTVAETEGVRETAAGKTALHATASENDKADRGSVAVGPTADFAPRASQHLIVKDATVDLEVENTDRAIDGVTQTASNVQGYIISQRIWYEREAKFAAITVGVPVQEFENALRRLRGLAMRILNETASGEDVTDEFVDLQSRLRNLEATRDRIRSFLDQAKTIDELLEVNQQLSDMENQIEQVRGRLTFLQDRAAYSTITVNINPILPTPTPGPTPTPTPTPMPEVWHPGETAEQATDVLMTIVQGLAELLIWFVIVFGPFITVLCLLFWGTVKLARRLPASRTTAALPAATRQGDDSETKGR